LKDIAMTSLVIAEHDNVALKSATLSVVSAARKIGADVHVLVAGSGCRSAAEASAGLEGVTTVKCADSAALKDQLAEDVAALVVALAGEYSHVLAAATTFGKNFLPRVAALLDVAQVSDVVAIEAPDTFVRPIYAGTALATVKSTDKIKVVSVRPTGFDAIGGGGQAAIIDVVAPATSGKTTLVRRELTKNERPELGAARIVVSGGRGLGSGENYRRLLEPLADKLGAAMGASRAAVDAGFVPNDFQVGQTGKIVAPELYFAIGISGAIQHLAGMMESKVIVAINKDPEAPIFQIADYGLVADLFEAIPQLVEELG
jgi:electron transfer flavoprotein alpha subunit